MLASSAASSAAVAAVLRTLAGERTSWLSGDVADFAAGGHGGGLLVTGGREPSLALVNPSPIPSRPSTSRTCRRSGPGAGRKRAGPGLEASHERRCCTLGDAIAGLGNPRCRLLWPRLGTSRWMLAARYELRDAVGNRDDQGGFGAYLPLAARRLAKMDAGCRAAGDSRSHEAQSDARRSTGKSFQAVRQRADMRLGLPVAQSAGAAALDPARAVEPFAERRPAQDGARGMKARRRHQAAAVSSELRKASR